MMSIRARASLFGVLLLLVVVQPATSQRAGTQDTTRRLTVDEYQAMRRAWLEARRTGGLAGTSPSYGSAIVGSGAELRTEVRRGGASIFCDGWPGRTGDAWPMNPGDPGARDGRRGSDLNRGREQRDPAERGRADPNGQGSRGGARGGGRGGRGESNNWDLAFGNDCWPGYPWAIPGGPYAARGLYGTPFALGYQGGPPWPGYGYPNHGPGYQGYGYSYPGRGGGYPGYGFGYPGGFGSFSPDIPYGAGPMGLGPWAGFGGASEYGLGPWGYSPLYPFGWGSPDGGYRFPWPGVPGGECAEVTVTAGGGIRYNIRVAPRTFGLSRATDLDLAIDARLSSGMPVLLYGIDGRMLRLDPGPGVEDVRVRPCESR